MYVAERGKKGKKTSAGWQTLRLLVRLTQNSAVCSVKGGQLYIHIYIYFFYDKIKEYR